jgi:hypothetical protein
MADLLITLSDRLVNTLVNAPGDVKFHPHPRRSHAVAKGVWGALLTTLFESFFCSLLTVHFSLIAQR